MEKKPHSGQGSRESTRRRLPGDVAGTRRTAPVSFSPDATVHLALNASAELPLARNADRIESVIKRAESVVGNRDEALRWLGTPIRALDYATPISLLGTDDGSGKVGDVLGQMEHGIW